MNSFTIGNATLHHEECFSLLSSMSSESVDSIVTDPPYELGFMGKSWDASGIAYSTDLWREALRVLKPGGHMLAFSGSRTYHRMACAIEDAGFEIRDQIMWVYGSGFPKSLDVSKAIDKAAGAEREVIGVDPRYVGVTEKAKRAGGSLAHEYSAGWVGDPSQITAPATDAARQWQGWGTALKPAHEPICVARKPLIGTVAANVLAHGTGALNINGCRVPHVTINGGTLAQNTHLRVQVNKSGGQIFEMGQESYTADAQGRWPANLIHDGSDEVLEAFPEIKSGALKTWVTTHVHENTVASFNKGFKPGAIRFANHPASFGSAARFFYCAKASKSDRGEGNVHPTVKPTDLMRHLVRMVTPPGGLVLDPFTGSGSTGKAAVLEGFSFIGCELSSEYFDIAQRRISEAITQIPSQMEICE